MRKKLIMAGCLTMMLGLAACSQKAEPTTNTQTETTSEVPTTVSIETTETTEELTTEQTTEASTEATGQISEIQAEKQTVQTTEEISSEKESEQADSGAEGLTEEDALTLLQSCFGEKDAETGYTYSFGYIGNATVDGTEYLVFDFRWLVDDHSSRLDTLFVAADGSAVYSGVYADADSQVYTETNHLDKQ